MSGAKHIDETNPAEVYVEMLRLRAELSKWTSVFGHLGTPDEVGNEWLSLTAELDALRKQKVPSEWIDIVRDLVKLATYPPVACQRLLIDRCLCRKCVTGRARAVLAAAQAQEPATWTAEQVQAVHDDAGRLLAEFQQKPQAQEESK